MATTKWVAAGVVPVLTAAFVILYGFPHDTMKLWGWMICPSMSALIMGAGYLSGAYFFTRAATGHAWHRVGVGFLATTVFASMLLVTTVLHWDRFNYDHVSFWAWILLYGTTPFLLPILWVKNQRTDPGGPDERDTEIPRGLRTTVGVGGSLQLAVAAVMFFAPATAARYWPWGIDAATSRSIAAFIAFPAVTWVWFLVESRWSCFRVTEQMVMIAFVLIAAATVRAEGDFLGDAKYAWYLAGLGIALTLNVALYVAMERRRTETPAARRPHAIIPAHPG